MTIAPKAQLHQSKLAGSDGLSKQGIAELLLRLIGIIALLTKYVPYTAYGVIPLLTKSPLTLQGGCKGLYGWGLT